jgi:hypothetical protein
MWQFLIETQKKAKSNFAGIVICFTLSLGMLLLGISSFLASQGVFVILFLLGAFLFFRAYRALFRTTYRVWKETWEGRVVKKYIQEVSPPVPMGGTSLITESHLIDLNERGTVSRHTLAPSEWESVAVGDYVVKKSGSYQIEIQSPRSEMK